MRKREIIKAMRGIVRELGRDCKIFVGNHVKTNRVLFVPIALVYEDDKTTCVEITYDGYLDIMGWDGTEGLGDHAEKFKREDLERLYAAMCEMGGEMDARDCWGYPLKVGQRVTWRDPETQERKEYEVYEIHSAELVKLSNAYGECEAQPHECKILNLLED